MGKRGASTQSKHDQKVLKEAKALQKKGFSVKADIKGFDKPKSINGRRPDVQARKGKVEKIIEIETPKTLKTDIQQQNTFEKYADRGKNRSFGIKIAK